MVQQLQSLQRQKWTYLADGFSFLGDDRGETACRNDGGGMSQFPFHATDDAVDQTHIAEEEPALNAPDRIDADYCLGPDYFHLG